LEQSPTDQACIWLLDNATQQEKEAVDHTDDIRKHPVTPALATTQDKYMSHE
jgi:hypothetical protein